MAAKVQRTLEYRGGHLNVALVLEVENFTNWKKSWDDLILYHEGPSDVKESRVIDLKLCYNTFKFKEESELAYLLGKLKYEENLIDSIYGTNQEKILVSATTLSAAFFSTSIVKDFQDCPDDKEGARSSQEYMNDLEEEYQPRALLAKSKRFFKKGTQRFSSAKATDQTECHKCGRKVHFSRDCFSKTSVPSYQSPFQTKLLQSSEHKPELKHIKDFKAKYTKFKAKLALLSSSTSASNSSLGKNKGLIAETYEWDDEEVSSDDNKGIEVKALMALTNKERVFVGKESASNREWVKISIQKLNTLLEMEDNDDRKSFLDYLCIDLNYVEEQRNNLLSKHRNLVQELNTCKEHFVDNSNVSITSSNKNRLSEAEDSTLPTHDTGKERISHKKTKNQAKSDKTGHGMEKCDESSVCSTPLSLLEKLAGVKPVFGPKTIKLILKSKSTFKAKALKGVIINEPSSAPAKGNISTSVSNTNSSPAGKLKNVTMKDDPPLAIVMKELNELKLQISKNKYKRTDHRTCDHAEFMSSMKVNQHYTGQGESSLRSRPSRLAIHFPSCIHCGYNDHQSDDCVYYPICELCGSYDHDTHGHNMIISLRRGIKPRSPQHVTKICEKCGSNVHTITDHNDIEWFRKIEALQAKKTKTFKTSKTESSSALRSKTPTKRWVSKQN
ncbi:retrovirus-related pol polyprotein from transposon TNT 1-94 [Tanacetum coccineum]|uniref:Retrovirus-related pol polyprotein from transposon TNT 1-94 n=1 Tax=Tanacetum coccineum TaxID=301880 RepID=A0ABQ4ZHH3_9ASTR